ncbi:hypothetical protein [Streptacidiphilus sp. MAP5-52]|uniref:hypothetical protein n=1 Tax=Streptacidiphilus sp. MAP5-52 TaxID=3156267 RepID=UPI0035146C47
MNVGQRVELTARIEALGNTAYPGDQGTVEGVHSGGSLTVRMDNGRTHFPTRDEVTALPEVPQEADQEMRAALERGRRNMREYLS